MYLTPALDLSPAVILPHHSASALATRPARASTNILKPAKKLFDKLNCNLKLSSSNLYCRKLLRNYYYFSTASTMNGYLYVVLNYSL